MDLDALLWEHDANEDESIHAGEGVRIEGIWMWKTTETVTLCA